jgi:hypothetical protein
MKKMIFLMVFMVITAEGVGCFKDLESTPPVMECKNNTVFLEAALGMNQEIVDEYSGEIDEDEYLKDDMQLPYIDEYDRYVTDAVQVAPVGKAELLLRKMAGTVLMHYITIRETTRFYTKEMKDTLKKWYRGVIKKYNTV